MTDRAVSDVVGYVLVFSLIVATIGIVTTVGFATLEDRQSAEQLNNAERAFDVFANNADDIYRGGAPSRATEMRLAGGTLRYGEPTELVVRDADDSDQNRTVRYTPLVYTDGDAEIAYEGGAVIRDDGHGGAMVREPPFRIHSERTLLPLLGTTRALGPTAVSRDGTVQVETVRTSRVPTTPTDLQDADEIEIEVDSQRQSAWNRYLERQADTDADWEYEGDGVLRIETESLEAPQFRMRLRFAG